MGNNRSFPKSASFEEQRKYVQNLPPAKEPNNLTKVIRMVNEKESPFSIATHEIKEVDPNIKLQLYHHSLGAPTNNEKDDELDSEDGIELTHAEVMRVLNVSAKNKNEKITINLPDPNHEEASTITLKFGEDGTFKKAYQKKIPFTAFGKGLYNDEKSKVSQVGIIAEASDDQRSVYSAFTRQTK